MNPEDAATLSLVISGITLVVFFFMANNVHEIKKHLTRDKEKEDEESK